MQFKEALEIMRAAKDLGVTRLTIGEFSVAFEADQRPTSGTDFAPPAAAVVPDAERLAQTYRRLGLIPQGEELTAEQYAAQSQPLAQETHQPAIRSIEDDPDVYARNSDAWANQTRLPQR